MNDEQINAIAQGIMLHLMKECKYTADAYAIIVCLILLYYDTVKRPDAVFTIEEFAKDMNNNVVQSWNTRTSQSQGTDTIQ